MQSDAVEAVAKAMAQIHEGTWEDVDPNIRTVLRGDAAAAIDALRSLGWTALDEWEEAPDAMTGEMKYRRRTGGGASSHRRILNHVIRTDKDRETVEAHRADIRKRQEGGAE